MKRKTHRQEIGEKLYDEFLSKPMGEMPSDETVRRWKLLAEQRRSEKERKKRLVCRVAAAVMILCIICTVCINVAGIVSVPYAEADNKGERVIRKDMQVEKAYESMEKLPADTKKEFLLFPEKIKDYRIIDITESVVPDEIKKLSLAYQNSEGKALSIDQLKCYQKSMVESVVDNTFSTENWWDIEVYCKQYENDDKETVYAFWYDKIFIKINVQNDISKDTVKNLLKETAQLKN